MIEADEGRRTLFTTRQAAGRPLSDLIADELLDGSSIRQSASLRALRRTAEFLAMIHALGGSPTDIERTSRRGRRAWRRTALAIARASMRMSRS